MADLIDLAMKAHGVRSGRALGEVARQRNLPLERTQINSLRSGKYHHQPQPATLRAIAQLAGVDEARVFQAAGVAQPRSPFAAELHPDADYLEPVERRVVNDLIRLLTRGRAETAGDRDRDVQVRPELRSVARIPGEESEGQRQRRIQDEAETGPQESP